MSNQVNFTSRVLSSPKFWAIFVIVAFSVPIVRTIMKKQDMQMIPVYGQAPEFSFKNQDGAEVTEKDLLGKVSV